MQRIAVTGSSGYVGGGLLRLLRERYPAAEILGLDVVRPRDPSGHEFALLDMRRPEFAERLIAFRPDTLIHMAFVVPPRRNERKMHETNIGGSRNVLAAAAAIRPQRLMICSSATALGARADNPVPMDDRSPLRNDIRFSYAAHKIELEALTAQYAAEHSETLVSWVRPCVVLGPNADNYLSRMLLNCPWVVRLDGFDSPLQFVHEDDVSAACCAILERGATGPFNITPVDSLPLSEIAKRTNRWNWSLGLRTARVLTWLAWQSRFPLHEYPPTFLDYIRYPWVAAPNRLRNELGFEFRHSTSSTLDLVLEHTRRRKAAKS